MKILLLAIAILVLVTGMVIWESLFVADTTASLLHAVEQMPDNIPTAEDLSGKNFVSFHHAYDTFCKIWRNTRWILNLFVGNAGTERIEGYLEETGVRYLAGDIPGYLSARKKLIAELEKLRDLEKLSFDSFT
ncbi:MAG: DUF4363 family protein [Ruminococcaceae bacterium]|nr:DUF4363 family protein [Oscillospiraceae bacterium]